jgi:hypothetical protein
MDASLRLRYTEDRQLVEQWISTRTVLGTPVEKEKAGDSTTEGGRRGRAGCETCGVKRGWVTPEVACEPPPKSRELRRRFAFGWWTVPHLVRSRPRRARDQRARPGGEQSVMGPVVAPTAGGDMRPVA